MRDPSAEEMAPVIALLHDLTALQRRQAEERQPLQREIDDAMEQVARACGVPPGMLLDETGRRWLHPQTREPLVEADG